MFCSLKNVAKIRQTRMDCIKEQQDKLIEFCRKEGIHEMLITSKSLEEIYNMIYEYFSKGEYEKALALKEEVTSKFGKDIWAPQFLFMEAALLMKNKEDSTAFQKLNNPHKLLGEHLLRQLQYVFV